MGTRQGWYYQIPKILIIALDVVILLACGAVTLLQQVELGPF
jgi:hypothetical protein|tara:strand:+ start:1059 stop:1184 length:126 start_codon:yes stop_codon:yes gene_type:complete